MTNSTLDDNFVDLPKNPVDPNLPLFEEATLAFHHDSIKLMRKNYAYQSIPYKNLQQVIISKGYSLKNKLLTSGIFSTLFFTACFVLYQKQNMLISLSDRSLVEYLDSEIILYLLGPAIAIFVAVSSIISIFTTQPVIHFEVDNKIKETKLKEIAKNGELEDLFDFLQTKTKVNLKLD